jgi:hypothetical protein
MSHEQRRQKKAGSQISRTNKVMVEGSYVKVWALIWIDHRTLAYQTLSTPKFCYTKLEGVSKYSQKKGEIISTPNVQSDCCDPKHNMGVTLRLVERRSCRAFGG